MDEVVQNVLKQILLTPLFRTEYVKAMNLYKRIAKYDIQLPRDVGGAYGNVAIKM